MGENSTLLLGQPRQSKQQERNVQQRRKWWRTILNVWLWWNGVKQSVGERERVV